MTPIPSIEPSKRLFYPVKGLLYNEYFENGNNDFLADQKEKIQKDMQAFLAQKNYPCVAALQSFYAGAYQVGIYDSLGEGSDHSELHRDLLQFIDLQKKTKSNLLTFWAVFPKSPSQNEDTFEQNLWNELSFLTSYEEPGRGWDPTFSADPKEKKFCFSLGGSALFVVGLHNQSSRVSRRFPHTTLIFNLYDQFRDLATRGKYDSMVLANRRRDLAFQGSVNPMAEKHGDLWEAIQFSGRQNTESWTCPFVHGLSPS